MIYCVVEALLHYGGYEWVGVDLVLGAGGFFGVGLGGGLRGGGDGEGFGGRW